MASRIEIRQRGRITLVGTEIIILSIVAAIWLKDKYAWDTFSTFIAGIVIALVLAGLFFSLRFFRYVFTIAFSLIWGFIAFEFARNMTDSAATRWVTFGLVTLFSAYIHKDYFAFESLK